MKKTKKPDATIPFMLRLSEERYMKLIKLANKQELTMSEYLRGLIDKKGV